MSFQAYLDTIREKTGKGPDDFRRLATERGLTKHGEVVAWLKADFGLGHGHANAIAALLLKSDAWSAPAPDKLEALFSKGKAVWRPAADRLIAACAGFGADFAVSPNESYVNLLRGKKKFAILLPSSAERLDVGIKRRGVGAEGRFELAGSWNAMVTHRVRITDPAATDDEVISWLKLAYDAV